MCVTTPLPTCGRSGAGTLRSLAGPVARTTASATIHPGSPVAPSTYRARYLPVRASLTTSAASPRTHVCGSSAASDAQKSRKSAVLGSAYSSGIELTPSAVAIRCRWYDALGGSMSSLVRPCLTA